MKFAAALLCALCGAAYAGSVYTPAPSAGGATYAPVDPMQAGSVTAWTLTDWADAGLAGIRSHMWTESAANTYIVTYTLHTATTSAVLPWEA